MKPNLIITITFFCLITTFSFAQNRCYCDFDDIKERLSLVNQRDSVEVFNLIKELDKTKLPECILKSFELEFRFYLAQLKLDKALEILNKIENYKPKTKCENQFEYCIYINKAKYFKLKSDYESLSDVVFKALKKSEELNKPEKEIEAIKEIVHLFTRMNEDYKNWDYIKRAQKLIFDVDNPISSVENYRWLSFEYEKKFTTTGRKSLLDSMFVFANQAKKGALRYEMYAEIALSFRALEAYSYHQGEASNALKYIDSAIYFAKKIKGIKNLSGLYLSKSWDHLDLGENELAVKWMDTSFIHNISNDVAAIMMHHLDASDLYEQAGRLDKAYASFKTYAIMKDSILNIERTEVINELETKYKTELKDAQIKRQNVWLIIATLVFVLILFIGSVFQLKRLKQKNLAIKQALEKQIALEKELTGVRENIAQDFHDDLGNRLARISLLSNLVNKEVSNKEEKLRNKVKQITDDANELYLGTRDFIFSLKVNSDYIEELATYLSDFGQNYFSKTDVKFVLEKHIETNDKLPYYWSKQLIYIFKEAMTNALKYAECRTVKLKFSYINKELSIKCIDDGKGMEEADLKSPNGLKNMKERVKKIGGSLIIKSREGHGTKILFKGKTA